MNNLALVKDESKGLQIQNWDDLMRISDFFSKSALIPTHLRQKPADIAIILMKGAELGFQAMQAMDSIDVINGKPALKPEAQMALIYQKFPGLHLAIVQDEKAVSVTVEMGRVNGTPTFTTTWSLARARQMGLDQKDNYKKQPLTMLKWRALGEAARTVFPDITRGLYNTEEASDFKAPGAQASQAPTSQGIKDAFSAAKEVEVETVNTTPEAPELIPEPSVPENLSPETSLGDYIPHMKAWPKGVPLRDKKAHLGHFLQTAKDYVSKNDATKLPEWVEFINICQEYLAEGSAEPSFADFSEPTTVSEPNLKGK